MPAQAVSPRKTSEFQVGNGVTSSAEDRYRGDRYLGSVCRLSTQLPFFRPGELDPNHLCQEHTLPGLVAFEAAVKMAPGSKRQLTSTRRPFSERLTTRRNGETIMRIRSLLSIAVVALLIGRAVADTPEEYRAAQERVVADCSKALEKNPKDAEAYQTRGAAYFKLGKIKESLADFDWYLELRPATVIGNAASACIMPANTTRARNSSKATKRLIPTMSKTRCGISCVPRKRTASRKQEPACSKSARTPGRP